jgi:hypothetical protein
MVDLKVGTLILFVKPHLAVKKSFRQCKRPHVKTACIAGPFYVEISKLINFVFIIMIWRALSLSLEVRASYLFLFAATHHEIVSSREVRVSIFTKQADDPV